MKYKFVKLALSSFFFFIIACQDENQKEENNQWGLISDYYGEYELDCLSEVDTGTDYYESFYSDTIQITEHEMNDSLIYVNDYILGFISYSEEGVLYYSANPPPYATSPISYKRLKIYTNQDSLTFEKTSATPGSFYGSTCVGNTN